MEERLFLLNYRQSSPKGQEFAREKLREAAARAEQEQVRGKVKK